MARVSLSDMGSAGEGSITIPTTRTTTKKASRSESAAAPAKAAPPADTASGPENDAKAPTGPAEAVAASPSAAQDAPAESAAPAQSTRPATPGLTIVGVTVPIALYEQLTATLEQIPNDRTPSYAQIVSWTCADHPEQVAEAALAYAQGAGRVTPATAADAPARRRPRGRPPKAGASTKLTLRFHGDELDPVQDLERRPVPKGVRMTRTAVAAGALQVALSSDLVQELLADD